MDKPRSNDVVRVLVVCWLVVVGPGLVAAWGHPHCFIETSITFELDETGLQWIKSRWAIDLLSSSFLTGEHGAPAWGELSLETAETLSQEMTANLCRKSFYTEVAVDGQAVEITSVTAVRLYMAQQRLSYEFAFPCPVAATEEYRRVQVTQYDPSTFTAFSCGIPDYRVSGGWRYDYQVLTADNEEHRHAVRWYLRFRHPCQAVVVTASPAGVAHATTTTPAKAASFWQVAGQQRLLSRLQELLRAQARGAGSWSVLVLLCLAAGGYGVLHATGPGHGKLITAAWLLGGNHSIRAGIGLGLMVAVVHGLSGVVTVLAGRYLLQQTVMHTMDETETPLRVVSFGLITLLGILMLTGRLQHRHKLESSSPVAASQPLLAVALAAGMVPCPAVVMVMLLCTGLGLPGMALLLSGCIIAGMAVTISGGGALVVMLKQSQLWRRHCTHTTVERLERLAHLAGGTLVLLLGLSMLVLTLSS